MIPWPTGLAPPLRDHCGPLYCALFTSLGFEEYLARNVAVVYRSASRGRGPPIHLLVLLMGMGRMTPLRGTWEVQSILFSFSLALAFFWGCPIFTQTGPKCRPYTWGHGSTSKHEETQVPSFSEIELRESMVWCDCKCMYLCKCECICICVYTSSKSRSS
jgi:hypothetical protein